MYVTLVVYFGEIKPYDRSTPNSCRNCSEEIKGFYANMYKEITYNYPPAPKLA